MLKTRKPSPMAIFSPCRRLKDFVRHAMISESRTTSPTQQVFPITSKILCTLFLVLHLWKWVVRAHSIPSGTLPAMHLSIRKFVQLDMWHYLVYPRIIHKPCCKFSLSSASLYCLALGAVVKKNMIFIDVSLRSRESSISWLRSIYSWGYAIGMVKVCASCSTIKTKIKESR